MNNRVHNTLVTNATSKNLPIFLLYSDVALVTGYIRLLLERLQKYEDLPDYLLVNIFIRIYHAAENS